MSIATSPTTAIDLAAEIRGRVLQHISKEGLDTATVAQKLGVAELTVQALLNERYWDVQLAINVASQLGIRLHVA